MLELHKTPDLILKQPEDWNRECKQHSALLEQNHSMVLKRLVLSLFNRKG
ncbi:hypothetical protein [Gracilinema caldarium]|nr:hypothetical protein [Gracilinema caldarium]